MPIDKFYAIWESYFSLDRTKKDFYAGLLKIAAYYRAQGEQSARDFPRGEGS